MNKKGFTLIELLAVIVILALIALIATPIILGIIEDSKKNSFKASTYGISQAAKNVFIQMMYAGEDTKSITYTYTDGVEVSNPSGYNLNYDGDKPKSGKILLTTEGKVALALHDGKWCATKSYTATEITLQEATWVDCEGILDELISVDYNETEGVNIPKLTSGMTAIKWNSTTSTWDTISNPEEDTSWYDYSNKEWANAKTADGSYWVWIPRYAYKITSGYHTATAGTIDVKFLKNSSNSSSDGTAIVDVLSGGQTSADVYVKHPAFKFGDEEVTGMWVAKFEPSVANTSDLCYTTPNATNCDLTTIIPKFIPGVPSFRYLSISTAFTISRNLEGINNPYNFVASKVDTHLIKSNEWGAVAYLSKSKYGKETIEVYINNSSTYITGCAANDVSAVAYAGCQNAYSTTNGFKASTTGNIYGIYDMSGSGHEFSAAYVNNGNINLGNTGQVILDADAKYKNVYVVDATLDEDQKNYVANASIYGDAVYETSSAGTGALSWYGDYSTMVDQNLTWLCRSGNYNSTTSAGLFRFAGNAGSPSVYYTFRPVVLVGEGL